MEHSTPYTKTHSFGLFLLLETRIITINFHLSTEVGIFELYYFHISATFTDIAGLVAPGVYFSNYTFNMNTSPKRKNTTLVINLLIILQVVLPLFRSTF